MLYFYTDYMEGTHPEVMRRLMETNLEHTTGYGSDQYTQRAKHAVRMAMKLKQAFNDKGYKIYMDSPTNQQFVCLPNTEIDRLSPYAGFELWGPRGEKETVARFVTSWATCEEDVDALRIIIRNTAKSLIKRPKLRNFVLENKIT